MGNAAIEMPGVDALSPGSGEAKPGVDPAQVALDDALEEATIAARYLPELLPRDAVAERAALVDAVGRGDAREPAFPRPRAARVHRGQRAVDRARALAHHSPAGELYLDRLEELELELALAASMGHDRRSTRRIAARRYGTGDEPVPVAAGEIPALAVADELLATFAPVPPEPPELPPLPRGEGEPSAAGVMVRVASRAGLALRVRVEPRLVSKAAASDGTVFLAPRPFGFREAFRLAAHEVLGHVCAAANGRRQPLRLFHLGTASSFEDQEGLCLLLEERSGLLDVPRLRMLAGRVVATACFHGGAHFLETARHLHRERGFSPEQAVGLAERTYRGGGLARDAAYLRGWLRVRRAVADGDASVDALRAGRVGLSALDPLTRLRRAGVAVPSHYRPSLAYSLFATESGTSRLTSPPSFAASFTTLELT